MVDTPTAYLESSPPPGGNVPGHGTMMLSKIAGKTLGVVRNPDVVIVRTQDTMWPALGFLQLLDYVLWHWKQVRGDGRIKVGIMSMSTAFAQLKTDGPGPDAKGSGNDGGVRLPDISTRSTATNRGE